MTNKGSRGPLFFVAQQAVRRRLHEAVNKGEVQRGSVRGVLSNGRPYRDPQLPVNLPSVWNQLQGQLYLGDAQFAEVLGEKIGARQSADA